MFLGLFLARTLGQAGHKVIMVDEEGLEKGLSLTRFSKYVSKFINLGSLSKADYIDGLLEAFKNESVDWFIPLSTKNQSKDVEAKCKMEELAWKKGTVHKPRGQK